MSFTGKDRRRHRVFITRNTEYHLRDDVCVAVRDRSARKFRGAHLALNLKLQGALTYQAGGRLLPATCTPGVGAAIYFTKETADGREHQIVTSRVERIERPQKADVLLYPPPR